MNDKQLIKGCQRGDKDSFKILIERYAPKLLGVAMRYVQNKDDGQDVLQNTYIHIFQNIHKYKHTGSLEGWLKTIAINNALKHIRSQKNWITHVDKIEDYNHFEEAKVIDDLNNEDILEVLNVLPMESKVIFNMSIVDGYSHKEIAERLNITESYSRVKLTRARKELADIINKRTSNELERARKIN